VSANVAAELIARLRMIQARAAVKAPKAAVQAMGRGGEGMVKTILKQRTHSAGTPTPSQPGQPPALVSGKLRRSVHRAPALAAGGIGLQEMTALVIYAAVQERGAVITVRSAKVLANPQTGQFFGPRVRLPARPFFEPAVRKYATSGLAGRVTGEAFVLVLFA
jgi:hypothetical protein